jgi:ribosome maturation factor RimP
MANGLHWAGHDQSDKRIAMTHNRLSDLLSSVLSAHSLELDDLEITPAGRRRLIRVTVDGDGPTGRGPDLDQIAEATRVISRTLDESEDLMGDRPYTLEVSSRGVSRPLTRPAHYRRNTGRLVVLTMTDQTEMTGRINAADDDAVTLDAVGDAAGQRLSYDQITRAVVQVEMNRRADPADPGND